MHTGHANIAFASLKYCFGDGSQRRLQIDDTDANTQDVDALDNHESQNVSPEYESPGKTPENSAKQNEIALGKLLLLYFGDIRKRVGPFET
jgi:hypothetical protein